MPPDYTEWHLVTAFAADGAVAASLYSRMGEGVLQFGSRAAARAVYDGGARGSHRDDSCVTRDGHAFVLRPDRDEDRRPDLPPPPPPRPPRSPNGRSNTSHHRSPKKDSPKQHRGSPSARHSSSDGRSGNSKHSPRRRHVSASSYSALHDGAAAAAAVDNYIDDEDMEDGEGTAYGGYRYGDGDCGGDIGIGFDRVGSTPIHLRFQDNSQDNTKHGGNNSIASPHALPMHLSRKFSGTFGQGGAAPAINGAMMN
jgi:hypothetical protein